LAQFIAIRIKEVGLTGLFLDKVESPESFKHPGSQFLVRAQCFFKIVPAMGKTAQQGDAGTMLDVFYPFIAISLQSAGTLFEHLIRTGPAACGLIVKTIKPRPCSRLRQMYPVWHSPLTEDNFRTRKSASCGLLMLSLVRHSKSG
jgi:hypothetical protein